MHRPIGSECWIQVFQQGGEKQLRENALRQDEDYIVCVTWIDITATAVYSGGGGVSKNPVSIH